jgi:hypothetical protein
MVVGTANTYLDFEFYEFEQPVEEEVAQPFTENEDGTLDINVKNAVVSGIITSSLFVGNGSGLTGLTAVGPGIEIEIDGSLVGTASTINFGNTLDVNFLFGGVSVDVKPTISTDSQRLGNNLPNYYLNYDNFVNTPTKLSDFNNDIGYITNSTIKVQNNGSLVGTASTINFGNTLDATFLNGTSTINISNNSITNEQINSSANIYSSKLSFLYNGMGANVRTVESKLSDIVSVKDFGAVGNGVTDDTSAIQEAINASNIVYIPPGIYRCNSSITLKSYLHLYGVRGASILRQYGDNMFLGATGMKECIVEKLTLDYRTSVSSPYHCAFKLKSHSECVFQDLSFTRYNDCTIFERFVQADDTINTVFNKYANMYISACNTLDVAAGFEEYQYVHVGDGVTTIINTGKIWPEQFNSSVVVLKESDRRIFSELTLSTDYTVGYPSGQLQVVLTSAAASNERIWIYPSCPREANRRPITNNSWEHIRASLIFSRGHTAVRWLDAETYTDEYLRLASDFAVCYDTNPYLTRGGQGGDYNTYNGCVLTYQSASPGLTDSTTCRAFRFGPGSFNMVGDAVKIDLTWINNSGNNHSIEVLNKGIVQLTGIVFTTSGSNIVTGTGTEFRKELSLIGSVPDVVQIGGRFYGITSIDSNLQITLSSNAVSTLAGVSCFRHNFSDKSGYDITFSSFGAGTNNRRLIQTEGGQSRSRSRTLDYGTFVIPSGQTSATVSHRVWRIPASYEIRLTPASLLNGRSISVSNLTATTFQVNISSAAASDYTIGYVIELLPLNLFEVN